VGADEYTGQPDTGAQDWTEEDLFSEPGQQGSGAPSGPVMVDLGGRQVPVNDITEWERRATDHDRAIAASTQRWQEAQQERQAAEAMRQEAQRLKDAFYADPEVQDLLRARQMVVQDPRARANYYDMMGAPAIGGAPIVEQLYGQLNQLRQTQEAILQQQRFEDEYRVRQSAQVAIDDFRAKHPDMADDNAFRGFMVRMARETDTANLEHAYRALMWDSAQGQARSQVRDEFAAVEARKPAASLMRGGPVIVPQYRPAQREGVGTMNQAYNAIMADSSLTFDETSF
jgi:hypothetical protein